jgi:hypothetical protein
MPFRLAVLLQEFMGGRPHLQLHPSFGEYVYVTDAVIRGATEGLYVKASFPFPSASRFDESFPGITTKNCFDLKHIKAYLEGLMWSISEGFPFYFNAIQTLLSKTLLSPWCDPHGSGWELFVSFDEDDGDASGDFTVDQFDRKMPASLSRIRTMIHRAETMKRTMGSRAPILAEDVRELRPLRLAALYTSQAEV